MSTRQDFKPSAKDATKVQGPLGQQAFGWVDGVLPVNVVVGTNTIIKGDHAFQRFRSKLPHALVLGSNCTMDGVHFALGEAGKVQIGSHCFFSNSIILAEAEIVIGDYVVIGWNTTIADSDFHPISPAARIRDAIACSPQGRALPRPAVAKAPVFIEDDVWIGPNATILKGVRIGTGSFIEPGALVTKSIPPQSRVLGNPAQVIGTV